LTPLMIERVMPTAARARQWRMICVTLLVLALLAASQTLWVVATDIIARQSWPQANGRITSISEESSAGIARASRRTRYWVRLGVRFTVPAGQCRTRMIDGQDGGLTACIGSVSTRSTQSTATAGSWMRESFRSTAVRVRYDPNGPEIKIVDDSVWLRYQWDAIAVFTVLILACAAGLIVTHRRLAALSDQAA
jgi:hypothetical protein